MVSRQLIRGAIDVNSFVSLSEMCQRSGMFRGLPDRLSPISNSQAVKVLYLW